LEETAMTEEEFDHAFDNFELDQQYSEYIMEHSAGDRVICNGHTLTAAIEDGYLFEEFRASCLQSQ
jgi:hypothetical protein